MQKIAIGLLGCGTVGSAVAKLLHQNLAEISRRAGKSLYIKKVLVSDKSKKRISVLDEKLFTCDINDILNDDEISIVIEVMGGMTPAKQYITQAMQKGKHVVTANKALLAEQGSDIIQQAKTSSTMLMFEAAVAGGIPIVKVLKEGLVANHIQRISAIVNGTSNYILTAMYHQQKDFKDVLNSAQEQGYAELDPTFDLEGIDAAHKVTLLATIAFGIPLTFEQVNISGISDITQLDIQYAKELGYIIKPLAVTDVKNKQYLLSVYPALLEKEHPLARVDGVMNALYVNADGVGDTMYYGAGAGGLATASAVVADIVDIVRTMTTDPELRVPHLAYQHINQNASFMSKDQITYANYLRLMVDDKVGVLASITQALAKHEISIEAILQKELDADDNIVPIVILTKQASETNLDNVLAELTKLTCVKDKIVRIRLAI